MHYIIFPSVYCGQYIECRKNRVPSLKAFMHDETIIPESKSHMKHLVIRLQELFRCASMTIKPTQCWSLSLINGVVREINFDIDGNEILTIRERNVKSLWLCFHCFFLGAIAGKMSGNNWEMSYAPLINVISLPKKNYGVLILA